MSVTGYSDDLCLSFAALQLYEYTKDLYEWDFSKGSVVGEGATDESSTTAQSSASSKSSQTSSLSTPTASSPPNTISPITSEISSASSMYRTASEKWLAQLLLTKSEKKKATKCREISLFVRKWGEESSFGETEEIGEKDAKLVEGGIEVRQVPVTWNFQRYREQKIIKNVCYKPSLLRWSWTLIEG